VPLRFESFTTRSRQAVAWIEDYDPGVRELLQLGVGPWAIRFDAEPVVLPVDLDLPPNVPRVTVSSRDRAWKLEVARRRIALIWELQEGVNEVAPTEFARIAGETLTPYLLLNQQIRTSRLGYVHTRFCEQRDAARELARFFCRDELLQGPLNRPESFELHAHKKYEPARMPKINSWIRWRTGIDRFSREHGVVVQHDLNTLAEAAATAAFGLEATRAFFTTATSETDSILRLYLGVRETAPSNR
jgi:hypothetical protein